MTDKKTHEATETNIFPIAVFTVSKEWMQNLFAEVKQAIMDKAITHDCPKAFLGELNSLQLDFSNPKKIALTFPEQSSSHASGDSEKPKEADDDE